jgi:hypothetical protein
VYRAFLLLFLPALFGCPSFANTCGVANVNQLLGTTCSIGSLDFTFTGFYTIGLNPLNASQISFSPDLTDPLRPGFVLTGPFHVEGQSHVGNNSTVNFAVAAQAGSILAIEPKLGAYATVIEDATECCGYYGRSEALFRDANLSAGALSGISTNNQGQQVVAGFLPVFLYPSPILGSSYDATTILEVNGGLTGGVSETLQSSSFYLYYNPAPPVSVPEPSALQLLALGLCATLLSSIAPGRPCAREQGSVESPRNPFAAASRELSPQKPLNES